ncbi:MAG: hypothetical protein QM704_14505 [Anaeromyxobacteraceae bacterium]
MRRLAPAAARVLAAVALLSLALPAAAGKPVPLALSPTGASVVAGGQVAFKASGGAGGYSYELTGNGSGGSIDPATGAYTAGATAGTDTVTVTDASGATRSAAVTVSASAGATGESDLGGHR